MFALLCLVGLCFLVYVLGGMGFSPFSAKNAVVRLNGQVVTAKSYTVEPDVDELDVSNFEAVGYSDAIGGLNNGRVTIELDLDGQANPWDSPRSLFPGTIITNNKLYMNNTGTAGSPTGPYWNIPSALVVGTPNPMNVKESGKLTIRLRTKGQFYPPTGNMTAS